MKSPFGDHELWWDSHPILYEQWRRNEVSLGSSTSGLARTLFGNEGVLRFQGVTTNPMLILAAQRYIARHTPGASFPKMPVNSPEDATPAYDYLVAAAAKAAEWTWRESNGSFGWVSAQVRPSTYSHVELMLREARRLASIAPNIMVKVPGSPEGNRVAEVLASEAISVNCTLSFSLAQFMSFSSAVERGKASFRGKPVPCRYVYTLMLGRIGEQSAVRSYLHDAKSTGSTRLIVRLAEMEVARTIDEYRRSINTSVELLLCSGRVDHSLPPAYRALHYVLAPHGAINTVNPSIISQLLRTEFRAPSPAEIGIVERDVMRTLERCQAFIELVSPDDAQCDFRGYEAYEIALKAASEAEKSFRIPVSVKEGAQGVA